MEDTENKKHKSALADIERLIPEIDSFALEATTAQAVEREAEVTVLSRVVDLLEPHFDRLADVHVTSPCPSHATDDLFVR